jgi:hypothetical protein
MALCRKAAGAILWSAAVCMLLASCNRSSSRARYTPIPDEPSIQKPDFIPFNTGEVIPSHGAVMGGDSVGIVLPAGFFANPEKTYVFFADAANKTGVEAGDVVVQQGTPWFVTCTVPKSFTGDKQVVDVVVLSLPFDSPFSSIPPGLDPYDPDFSVTLNRAFTYIDPVKKIDFQARETFAFGPVTDFVATDYSGDGWVDLIGRHASQNQLYFIRNFKGKKFHEPKIMDIPGPSQGKIYNGLLLGEVNNDGLEDLVVYGKYGFLVMINKGDKPMSYELTLYDQSRRGISGVLADLNKNGFGDLVMAGPDAVRVYYYDPDNNVYPTFASIMLESTFGIKDVAIADVNGDQLEDIVIVHKDRLTWYLADGENQFKMPFLPILFKPLSSESGLMNLVSADLNQDGFDDVIFTAADGEASGSVPGGTLAMVLADGAGDFEAPVFQSLDGVGRGLDGPTDLEALDLDKDGHIDAIMTVAGRNSVIHFLGDGKGNLESHRSYNVGAKPLDLIVFDMNKDGIPDLMVSEPEEETQSLLDGGMGRIDPAGGELLHSGIDVYLSCHPSKIDASDLDGDEFLDLVIMDDVDDQMAVMLNDGSGGFIHADSFLVSGQNPNSFCLFQANSEQDDYPDLAVIAAESADVGGKVDLFLNDGNGVFEEKEVIGIAFDPREIGAADIDNDGFQDLVITQRKTGSNVHIHGDGQGNFKILEDRKPLDGATGLALEDLDNDFDVDAVTTAPSEQLVHILPTDANGSLNLGENSSSFDARGMPLGLAVRDFNLDRFMDIALSLEDESQCDIHTNDTFAGFAYSGTIELSGPGGALLAADIDFDSKVDLIAMIPEASGLDLLMNREGQLERTQDSPVLASSFAARAEPLWVDLNGDLLPELVIPSRKEKKLTVLINLSK